MIREILKMGDERLLRIASPVSVEMFDSPELWQLIDDMFQTMESVGGVGLAAPQIGVDLQLVIFGFEHSERYPDAEAVPQTILINPLITPLSPILEEGFEGCLSVPGLRGAVQRYQQIRYEGVPARDGRPIPRGEIIGIKDVAQRQPGESEKELLERAVVLARANARLNETAFAAVH